MCRDKGLSLAMIAGKGKPMGLRRQAYIKGHDPQSTTTRLFLPLMLLLSEREIWETLRGLNGRRL